MTTCNSKGCVSYRCVEHGDVEDKHVLNNVDFALVLTQGANGNTVRAIAMKILDQNLGAIGLERNTVWRGVSVNRYQI